MLVGIQLLRPNFPLTFLITQVILDYPLHAGEYGGPTTQYCAHFPRRGRPI